MCAFKRLLFFAALAALLVSCAPPAATEPARATAQVLQVQITLTLRELSPILSECARRQWTLGLVLDERPASLIDVAGNELALRWGAPDRLDRYAAIIGQETLVLVVHPNNPLARLTRSQVRAIYNGSAFAWGAFLQPQCEDCAADNPGDPYAAKEIHAWAYPAGEDIRQIFEISFGMNIVAAAAGTVPDPIAARQAVAEDPMAITFLPARLVDGSVHALEIEGQPEGSLAVPILALGEREPQGLPRQWVACVTDQLK